MTHEWSDEAVKAAEGEAYLRSGATVGVHAMRHALAAALRTDWPAIVRSAVRATTDEAGSVDADRAHQPTVWTDQEGGA